MDPIAPIAPVMAASAAVTTAGLAGLRAARRHPPGWVRRAALGTAWGYLALGLVVARLGWPWEIAVPIWIGLAGLGGFAVTLTAELRQRGAARGRGAAREGGGVPVRPLAGRVLAAAVLGGGVAATGAALAVAAWLPVGAADRAVLAVVLWPLLWTWAVCHVYAVRAR